MMILWILLDLVRFLRFSHLFSFPVLNNDSARFLPQELYVGALPTYPLFQSLALLRTVPGVLRLTLYIYLEIQCFLYIPYQIIYTIQVTINRKDQSIPEAFPLPRHPCYQSTTPESTHHPVQKVKIKRSKSHPTQPAKYPRQNQINEPNQTQLVTQ